MDPTVLKAIGDYGLSVVGVVVAFAFIAWIVRDYIADLKGSRNRALDVADRQVNATEKLTEVVHELTVLVRDRGSR